MKKLVLLLGLGTLTTSMTAFAGAPATPAAEAPSVTLYGTLYPRLDVGYKKTLDKTTGLSTINNTKATMLDHGSRIGIRGENKLDDTYKFAYRLEWRTPFNTGDNHLQPRDMWLGITHKDFGTIKAGRMVTTDPYLEYTQAQPSGVDGFRVNNTVRYESPTFADTKLMAQYIMDEKNTKDSFGRAGYSLSLVHDKKDHYGLGFAYTYGNSKNKLHGVHIKDAFRTSGYYQLHKDWQINALYQQNRFTDKDYTEKGVSAGVNYAGMPSFTHYVVGTYTDKKDGDKGNYKAFSIGTTKEFNSKINATAELEFARTNNPSQREDTATLYLVAGYSF